MWEKNEALDIDLGVISKNNTPMLSCEANDKKVIMKDLKNVTSY